MAKTSSSRDGSGDPWKPLAFFGVLLIAVFGLIFFTGDKKPEPKLGIDLQGGTSVTLQATRPDGTVPDSNSPELEQARDIINQRVNGLGVAGSEVKINGSNLVITVPGEDGDQARTLGQTARLLVRPVLSAVPATPQPNAPAPDLTNPDTAKKALLDAKAARQSTDPAAQQKAASQLNCDATDPLAGNDDPKLPLVTCGKLENDPKNPQPRMVYTLAPSIIDGQSIKNASSGIPQNQAQYVVTLEFTGDAAKAWADYTSNNRGKQAAFVLDSQVITAPQINEPITGGQTQISGSFNQQSAADLANVLKYGSLPLSFKAGTAQTVSATLGFDSLRAGVIAGLIGLVLVLIYALAYYRALGVLVALSLVLSIALLYGLLVLLGRWIGYSLDLSGIAGIIIGIGMTADSFVVYFERIKDEIRDGRSFRSAVPRGWASARRTIWTGNAVSLLSAVVLYILAVGDVRGFAFTLGLSTVLDVVIVFLVTHPLVVLASRTDFFAKPSMNGLGAVAAIGRERRRAVANTGATAKDASTGSNAGETKA
ncbi:Protein translocase subunit SecD OS=Tsukamurella paurometabola (strain ATCC 8368 / DSM / CCUG 35730 / CIP 100753 / JCM 10117 / KCTC 9821 / NBRC 16120 /NCIMB 702349 / NCTC 13040) OX=521096 GN=secD PE=3 SV=1 [Tsukamurella paurometabola]|uniref:Protein translocase subunit SecD n=1 Tax=Tsukamurella paurometabola (strain ATCC 8368 / DSM 20162 / CCUG 35730 / CIP 100753 / JCM 10117 / KCTC 9821 / NBRC 16120 / NCIMB 702349 / NCTC 13040) TaxID=521096 RepID=D5UNI7_TSUPD|nr:protein translocase subunit SecD [Tsukamurella paurometabola]ADG78555.1 protein-export membrane protein SecD [Tsukamurella paurometabola DSM 20162]SUP32163.1 preprotein translocase subunit SecD [Tsukamurella paurometabola]